MNHSASIHIACRDAAPEAERHAYNAAFEALGLDWHWDAETYAAMAGEGPQGVRRYLESTHPHLLRAYDAEFLVQAIESTRARCQATAVRIPMPAAPLPGRMVRSGSLQQAA